ncbi:helix-turn-helix transcriptional regulator [Vibrio lentus]|nr:helix-turn-helix transcriptional regulator [Vibrio lentus]
MKIFTRETDKGELELWTVTPEYIDESTLMTHISLGLYFSIILKLIRKYLNAPKQKVAIHINKNTIGDEFLAIFERVFNIEMKEGYPARYLLFSNDLAQRKPRQFQPDFHAELVRIADQQMEKVLKTNLIYKVNETFKVLAVKDTNLDSVASNLHISPRTLNRKLKQESVSFRRLFDKYRLELSLTLLNQNDGNITYVAHELGFSDSSAFSRAFKKLDWALSYRTKIVRLFSGEFDEAKRAVSALHLSPRGSLKVRVFLDFLTEHFKNAV